MRFSSLFGQGRSFSKGGRKLKGLNRIGTTRRGFKVRSVEPLEPRQMLSVTLGPLNNIQVPGGKSVLVPLTGVDSAGQPINYTFSSTDPDVQLSIVSPTSPSLKLNVSGTDNQGNAFTGTLIIHLFDDLAPNTTARIEQLVNQNYYNGLSIFRILDGFVAQTGKTNNGADTGVQINDEFNTSLTFTSPGLLAMANAGSDTADSEFFITAIDEAGSTTPISLADDPQSLNFRYTIFGQLISGFDTFEKVMSTTVGPSSSITNPDGSPEQSMPTNEITITSASIINDTQDAVLQVTAPASSDGNSATITVTATGSNNDTAQQQFTASVVTDTQTDPPFLGPVPANFNIAPGQTLNVQLTSTDLSGAGVYYDLGETDGNSSASGMIDHSGGAVTITPNAGVTGAIDLIAGVEAASLGGTSNSNFDKQQFTVTVEPPTLDPVADQTTDLGAPDLFALSATDPVGDGLVYQIVDANTLAAPVGVTANVDSSGNVTITPNAGFTGTLNLLAEVRSVDSPDDPANYTTQPFTLNVLSPSLNFVASQAVAVGATDSFQLNAADPSGGGLIYKIVDAITLGTPQHVTIITDSSGNVTIKPDAGFHGEVLLLPEVRAFGSDDVPANYVTPPSTEAAFSLDVIPVSLAAVSDQTVDLGAAGTFALSASNPTGGGLVYKIVDANTLAAPANVTANVDSSGNVTVTPNDGFTGTLNLLAEVRAAGSDDVQANYTTQPFTLNVLSPSLNFVASQAVAVGVTDSFQLHAADPSGQGLIYKIVDANTLGTPQHVTITTDSSGNVTIKPDAGFHGQVLLLPEVRAIGSDDVPANYVTPPSTEAAFSLDVIPISLAAVTDQTVAEGVIDTFALSASNPTGGGLVYKIIDASSLAAPVGVTANVDPSGNVTIIPNAGFSGTLNLLAEVRASGSDDVQANYTTQAFTLNVEAPTLSPVATQITGLGTTLIFNLAATDPLGHGLIYSVVDANTLAAPTNVTATVTSSGQVTITPNAGFTGTVNLLARVRSVDSPDDTDDVTQAFTLKVLAPTLAAISDQSTSQTTAVASSPVTVQLTATDPAILGLQYSVVDASTLQAPTNATVSIDSTTHVATITPNIGFTGTLHLLARVQDTGAASDPADFVTQAFNLNVTSDVSLAPINNVQVPGGQSVLVPLSGTDAHGNPITYTFSSSDPNVTLSLQSPGTKSLQLNVSGTDKNGNAYTGTLVLQLFEDIAPETTARIEQLVNQGFYTGQQFFRVLDGFVAQNSGTSTLTPASIGPETTAELPFDSAGLLALANTGQTNGFQGDAQFFITAIDGAGSTTPISLAHMPQGLQNGSSQQFTVFGQLVSGFDTFEKIMSAPVGPSTTFTGENSMPTNAITITSASIITDNHDAVLKVTAPASFDGSNATITVTGTDSNQQTSTQTFTAAAVVAGSPSLNPVVNQTTTGATPVSFTLTSNLNNSSSGTFYQIFDATTHAAPTNVTVSVNQATGQVTLTPTAGFTGTLNLLAGVRATAATDTFTSYDTQPFTLTVNASTSPTLGPVSSQTTTTGTPITFTLTSTNPSGNPITYKVADATTFGTPANVTVSINQATGQVTLTPAAGFTGSINLLAGVRSTSSADVQASYSTQAFSLTVNSTTVNPNIPVPTALAVDTSSDTGPFDGNGYITTGTPKLDVAAETGATVQFKLNGTVIATGTETLTGSGQYTASIPAGKLAIGSNSITASVTDSTGTSGDSTALTVIYAPDYTTGVYVVPGAPGSAQQVTISKPHSNAAYKDEIGYFIADSANGAIGGIAPGAAGYAQAALSSSTRHVVLAAGSKVGTSDTISVQGGQFIVFYMIQDNTTANFLAKNKSDANHGNDNSADPLAFFSVEAANPDGMKHTQIIADPTTGRVQYNWEDLMSLGDSDFNDIVMTVQLAAQSSKPPATVHAPGTGNTTVTLKGTLGGGHQTTAPGDIGVFFTDNPDGTIGTLTPGSSGYAAAALASGNFQVLFASGTAAGAAESITVPAGKYLGFYVISSGTTANFLTANPTNASSGSAVAMFSFDAANANGLNHFRWFTPGQTKTDPSQMQLHIMDHLFGKEGEFDDLTAELSFSGGTST